MDTRRLSHTRFVSLGFNVWHHLRIAGPTRLGTLTEQKTVCKTGSPLIPSLGSNKIHNHISSIDIYFFLDAGHLTATFGSVILEQWRGQIPSIELDAVRWCVRISHGSSFCWDSWKVPFSKVLNCLSYPVILGGAVWNGRWYFPTADSWRSTS